MNVYNCIFKKEEKYKKQLWFNGGRLSFKINIRENKIKINIRT